MRLKNLFSKRNRALDEEMQFHLEKQIEANIAAGMPPEEARRQALIEFGGVQQTREAVRQVHWGRFLETVLQDLSFGIRMLRKSPGFTFVAVSILALGIGANTAIFSAVNAVLFARWPIHKQQQLVLVREPTAINQGFVVSIPNFEDYRRQQSTFEQLSLWVGQSINLTGRERPDRLIGAFVSDNFFELLGVRARLGRTFLPGDGEPGAANVAVISHEAWKTRFGGDPGFLNHKLILNNEPYAVVGVLPQGFSMPVSPSEVFIPAQHYTSYKVDRRQRSFLVFGRIKDGVTRTLATADLNNIAQRLAKDYPNENAGIHVELTGLQELTTENVRTPLLVLLGAVALVLLLVCANIANLLLARGVARQREIELRAALGASVARLIRQVLSESMLLALLGGVGGVLLAFLLLQALLKVSPIEFPINYKAVLDVRVLLFTAGISFLTAILFGVAPALQSAKANLSSALAGGRGIAGKPARDRLLSGFVVCQVAASLVLLVSAGLLVRSFRALLMTSPGFMPDHLLTMEYRLPPSKYRTSEAQTNFHRQLAAHVQQVPGVVSAAIVQTLPFSGNWAQAAFEVPGYSPKHENGLTAFYNLVSPEYFSTIGIPVLKGRAFSAQDDENSAPVAIISQRFADNYFSNLDPIGREIKIKDAEQLALNSRGKATKRAIVVGIVGNAKQRNIREALQPQVYFPYTQVPGIFGTLVVRTAVEPMALSEAVRQAVWSVDKDQPVWRVRSVDFLIRHDTAPDRFAMLLMSALSALALLLSALGTYGMLSNTVHQRIREMGVRIALGARPATVLQHVLMQGLKLIFLGCALGVPGAIVSARLIRTLLYGVNPGDITVFVLGVTLMVAIGLLAAYFPARRATRVDPLVALRYE